jgi:hypothetical protein
MLQIVLEIELNHSECIQLNVLSERVRLLLQQIFLDQSDLLLFSLNVNPCASPVNLVNLALLHLDRNVTLAHRILIAKPLPELLEGLRVVLFFLCLGLFQVLFDYGLFCGFEVSLVDREGRLTFFLHLVHVFQDLDPVESDSGHLQLVLKLLSSGVGDVDDD